MLTHVVFMTFTDESDTTEAVERLAAMAGRIPGLTDISVGADTTDGPYHLGLVTVFEDADALADYGTHPVHVEVVSWLRPRLADRAVVDFAT